MAGSHRAQGSPPGTSLQQSSPGSAGPAPPRNLVGLCRIVGPGIVAAATGVGAGDLVAATKAGASYGLPLLWTAALGAILKYALAEGVARWQLATGTTVLEGWVHRFGSAVRIYFLVYLVLWTFIVSAALMSACGLAAHALVPQLTVRAWASIHALIALAFVWRGGYGAVENVMKFVIALMFVTIIGNAAIQAPPLAETLRGLVVPTVPAGGAILILGVVGGVGGTLTLLSYNYWMNEKGWRGAAWARAMRFDLQIGYVLTGLFGVAAVLLGGMVLLPRGITVSGSKGVLEMATVLAARFGRPGELVFLLGFYGAVSSSLLGVWQGVPYMFGNYVGLLRGVTGEEMQRCVSSRERLYRSYVLFMTFPPMLLLLIDKPVWLVVAYAAIGALFMPFLAGTLLLMNNWKSQMGSLKNGPLANAALVLSLILFLYLAIHEIVTSLAGRG
jgi:Mn2+/Fe2+ NRAMP family transporter